jgi:primosomal protein N' (replication factor Y)
MSNDNLTFVDVLLPVAVPNLYTYHVVDKDDLNNLQPGMRVCVQFGKRKLHTALIVNIHQNPPEHYKTKPIVTLLDKSPVIFPWQIKFWNWIAEYYMCTAGEIYNAAIPNGLRPEGQTQVYVSELPESGIDLNSSEENIYRILNNNPGITIDKLNPLTETKMVMPILKKMMDKGIVTFQESLKDKHSPKLIDYLTLHKDLQPKAALTELLTQLEKRAPKQSHVLMAYLQLSEFHSNKTFIPVGKLELLKASNTSSAIIKTLVDKNIFSITAVETSRIANKNFNIKEAAILNKKQTDALANIKAFFKEKDVVLLHGVTSSGKTEVYIHLIKEQLEQGKQVLYLLPEIALTTQIITRLQSVFGNRVGVYHSKFSDGERVEVWNNLLGNYTDDTVQYDIILGVRSSVLLPFNNLGLIIVDEEHENTYKQYDPAPRYHARDSAIVLAALHKAKVLLGTATPSLESYFNAKLDKYGFVELHERHLDIKLPEIEVVNTNEARRKKLMSSYFSPQLIHEIQQALNNNEQIILFQNRRGFSPYLECGDCGWIPQCQHCDVSLTYHKGINKLRCHYCGYSISTVVQCKACGSQNVQTRGFGTEKIEDDIVLLFPQAKAARMDLDSTRRKNAYEEIIEQFASGQVDILIGTQMVSKGLDFDNVSVVGIMNADNMLNFPDFRAFERSFQLMAQVSGRAGRKKKQGKVIIQTSSPENSVIKQVVKNDFTAFFEEQMEERKLFRYPPYYRLINIALRHKQQNLVHRAAQILSFELRKYFGGNVLGPEPPIIGRIQNWHLQNIIIKLERVKEIKTHKEQIQTLCNKLKHQEGLSSLQIIIDVDPY